MLMKSEQTGEKEIGSNKNVVLEIDATNILDSQKKKM